MADNGSQNRRRAALAAFVHTDAETLSAALDGLADVPPARTVKGPEVGLLMVRGRTGGGGAPFNLGEASMTRCVVALPCGTTGFGHVLGREAEKARLVAILDALGQTDTHGDAVHALAGRLAAEQAQADAQKAAETAATRVEFFTMARENL